MEWNAYGTILRRRWPLVTGVILLTALASGYSFLKSYRHVGSQACFTLFVADVSAPSLISAPPSTLAQAGQLLAGETAANFFADDILDVAQSTSVARYAAQRLQPRGLPTTASPDIEGAVSGSRRDRTVNLCVTNPNSASASAIAGAVGTAMTVDRAKFIGAPLARRTFVKVVSPPSVGPAPAGHHLLNLILRLILGTVVALGLALLWDALDPQVRDERDVEQAVGAPVLGTLR